MMILFDESVPKPLKKFLPTHEVHTVGERGWDAIQNGALLALIEQHRYQVFLTSDQNMSYQQTLTDRNFAVLVLSTNHWPTLKQHIQRVTDAIISAVPATTTFVQCGVYRAEKRRKAIHANEKNDGE